MKKIPAKQAGRVAGWKTEKNIEDGSPQEVLEVGGRKKIAEQGGWDGGTYNKSFQWAVEKRSWRWEDEKILQNREGGMVEPTKNH